MDLGIGYEYPAAGLPIGACGLSQQTATPRHRASSLAPMDRDQALQENYHIHA
jgi:hypothetical protein